MIKENPTLSIIVPVYKVEKYLRKCIESVLSQTFTDFELILIDDGSPDSCPDICDDYAKKDRRIKVIHQINSGVSKARNEGLKIAQGEWITFVDSDDYLMNNAYELLLSKAIKNNCDAAIMDFAYVDENGNSMPGKERNYGGILILENKDLIRMQFDIPLTIRLSMINKLFRREIIKDLFYDESLKCAEDTLLLSQCLERVKKAVYVVEPLYFNVQRHGSAMHGGLHIRDIEKSLSIHKEIAVQTKKIYPDLYDYAYAYYIDSCIWKMRAYSCCPIANEQAVKEWNSIISRMRNRLRNEWYGIIKCKEIKWKQKLQYLWIGVTG